MSPAHDIGLPQVAGALALVLVALAVVRLERVGLERDIGVAVLRSFVQLTAVGYVIQFVLDSDHLATVAVLLAAMVLVAAATARARARRIPGAFWVLVLALGTATAATLGLAVGLGVFDATPRALVPVGGMVVGNAMTAAAVGLNRLGDEVVRDARTIEATLALGATSRQAASPLVRRSLASALIPLIDQTKTTGLIAFPGTMVGMLLAGAEPLDAVRLQLILLYLLLGAVALAAVVAVTLASRRLFTPAHQLRDLASPR